ncbi:GGDEF domain-containing protein [Bradyrhizobium canariense]|uniref:Diguanylate cyclase n=1 Tax=Bradyrhizobium canariense TaxID=255045 RepID=A0A1H1U5E6_9BRAD|nr:GGDEF domain-containing protein [Bradyrhizobium canariense]SDS67573.1 diguanylate cyclase [Bradyrhizobium canariense]
MFFAKIQSRTASISDAIYIEVIATLYGTMVPILVAGVCQAIVGTISVAQTGDDFTAILTVLGIIVALARMLVVLTFRRKTRRKPLLDRSEALAWERRYAAGTFTTALLLGLFAARSLFVGDAICLVMAVGIAFGFGAGIVARLSLRPVVALLDFCAVGLPAVVATFLKQWDVPHIAMGLMFLVFIVAGFEMVRLSYNSTLNQMTLKQKFEQLARIDPMTGLLNRSVLATDLERIVADGGSGMVAVQAIDLDHFKAANDRYGHPVGDALLKQVAARLMSVAGPADLIVRMGGDEFILAQRSVGSRGDAELMAQRIFETISAPYHVDGHEIVIGTSIGIALSPEHGKTVEALLARSDAALYRAKERRGGYVLASEPSKSQDRQHAA